MRSEPPAAHRESPGNGVGISPTRARAIAHEAFVFMYPLVANYGTMYSHAVDASAPTYSGGFGTWRRLGVAGGERNEPAAPAVAVRFRTWLDLRTEPQAVCLPDSPTRRVVDGSCFDLWGDRVTSIGSPGSDGGPARLLLTSPSWAGAPPAGVDEIVHGESWFLRIEVSVEDSPLGSFSTDVRFLEIEPLPGHEPPRVPPPVNWWPWRPGIETTHEFWACGNFALTFTRPRPQDRPILERIAEIGVRAGDLWDPLQHSRILRAVDAGMDDAVTELMMAARRPADHVPRGWAPEREEKPRYLARALNALMMQPPPTQGIASG